MSSNSPESLPEETQSMYSETGDSESLALDFQVTLEELYPGLITEPEIFIENLEQEAIDSIHPAIREIMNRGWYPELAENLKNATVWGYLQGVVVELNSNFPIERLEVAREVLEELKELDDDSDIYDTADDPRVKDEVRRVLSVLCPELMQKFEATEDSLEDVVGIFPENRIHMLFDSLTKRSERYKAYVEFGELDRSKRKKVLKSLSVSWRSYRVLYEIYPELLENPETLDKPQSNKELGFIKNPVEIQKLSDFESFSLMYVINRSLWCMLVGNAVGTHIGIVDTIAAVLTEKYLTAGKFLIQHELKRRLDEDSNLSHAEFFGEVFAPWFGFHGKFLDWRYKEVEKSLGNALEVELLMRALKDGHEKDIKEFLPNKDAWKKYVIEDGDGERVKRLR
ncbi:hypothetical protein KBG23_03180 [Candidatus Dojkabacteria bacterium]|nr:hypothetical protein [Candidatus Dojkabacteria bacterium]